MKHISENAGNAGNATLRSGESNSANREIGAPGVDPGENSANREIGDFGENSANREIGAPGVAPGVNSNQWHSRGYLPHFDNAVAIQHVTFHLADSLPESVLVRLAQEVRYLPLEKQDAERRKRLEAWIDAGHGSCIMREPPVARIVQNAFLFFDGQRYRLLAWVVMPNHVHVLFQPVNNWTVAKIVASWKKFTATKICSRGEIKSPVWHREYWDRFIRDSRHYEQAVEYIHQNPVKAGLAAVAAEWPWSSASLSGMDSPGVKTAGGPQKLQRWNTSGILKQKSYLMIILLFL
ncbi:MAG: transposase [Victivallaceae bacterium]